MQVCMQFAAAAACRGESVVYIDTSAACSASRLRDLCAANLEKSKVQLLMIQKDGLEGQKNMPFCKFIVGPSVSQAHAHRF